MDLSLCIFHPPWTRRLTWTSSSLGADRHSWGQAQMHTGPSGSTDVISADIPLNNSHSWSHSHPHLPWGQSKLHDHTPNHWVREVCSSHTDCVYVCGRRGAGVNIFEKLIYHCGKARLFIEAVWFQWVYFNHDTHTTLIN